MTKKHTPSDYENVKFGFLTPVSIFDQKRWLFKCDCGCEKPINRYSVFSGDVKSCGCIRRKKIGELNHTHGHSSGGIITPEFASYRAMMSRCNKKNGVYKNKGVVVCDRWKGNFVEFLKDMGEKPAPNFSLDRVDNTKGYSPENCRWATPTQQARNRSNTRKSIFPDGEMLWTDASKFYGVPYKNLHKRIFHGMSPFDAVLRKGAL